MNVTPHLCLSKPFGCYISILNLQELDGISFDTTELFLQLSKLLHCPTHLSITSSWLVLMHRGNSIMSS